MAVARARSRVPRVRSGKGVPIAIVVALLVAVVAPSLVIASSARAGHGVLRASTDPAGLPSLISVAGEPRNVGAISSLELMPGTYDVCFGRVEGFVGQDCQSVEIIEGQVTDVVGSFAPAGTLKVEVQPDSLAPVITVNGVERDRAPTEIDLAEGTHEVCFESLRGYEELPCEVFTVLRSEVTEVSVEYVSYPRSDRSDGRARAGLLALYRFDEGEGASVRDVAGVHEGLDLTITDTSVVSWTAEGLRFDRPGLARTEQAPSAFYDVVAGSEEFTVEAWVTPANTSQNGPARIVTLSRDTRKTNFLLGQGEWQGASDLVEVRLHERRGDYKLHTERGEVSAQLKHVVMTRSQDGTVKVYIDGEVKAQSNMAADLEGWDRSYRLGVGNELSGDRPWLGTFHLAALYGRALDPAEVAINYAAVPDGVAQLPAGRASEDAAQSVEPAPTAPDDPSADSRAGDSDVADTTKSAPDAPNDAETDPGPEGSDEDGKTKSAPDTPDDAETDPDPEGSDEDEVEAPKREVPASWPEAFDSGDIDLIREWYGNNTGHEANGFDVADLTPVGHIATEHDGQVIEGVHALSIRIAHDDVTIRNSRVTSAGGSGAYGIAYRNTFAQENGGTLIEYVTLDGWDEAGEVGTEHRAIVLAANESGAVVRRANISGYRMGCLLSVNATCEESWIHTLYRGGAGHGTSVTIRGPNNTSVRNLMEGPGGSSAQSMYADFGGPLHNALVEYNVMNDARPHYQINVPDREFTAESENVRVRHNRFGPDTKHPSAGLGNFTHPTTDIRDNRPL